MRIKALIIVLPKMSQHMTTYELVTVISTQLATTKLPISLLSHVNMTLFA